MNLNEEQILALAPDESSKKSGKELANPVKWANMGVNEKSLWGECQGSGKNPYRTQVDLANIAFKCSCPSRKFPCKHGLGVLLFYSRQQAAFQQTEAPDWVKEWIDKREEKAEKKQEKEDKPVDLEAQSKRREQRLHKVSGGIEEVQLVIKDIARNGILNMPEKGPALFSNLSKRMVDSQASGLAVMTRELAEHNYFKENWQSTFMDQLLRIYLTTTAFLKREQVPELLAEEVKSLVGFTQSTEELKQQEGTKDHWFVLGKQTEKEQQLHVQRNWLLGMKSGKYALVLQFYVAAQLPGFNLTPGTVIEAELSFYKSNAPFRAMVKETGKTTFPSSISGFVDWNELSRFEKEHYTRSPFIYDLPFFIEDVRLAKSGESWFLKDKENNIQQMICNDKKLFRLLALSGGNRFSAALIGNEGTYEPIGIFIDNKYSML